MYVRINEHGRIVALRRQVSDEERTADLFKELPKNLQDLEPVDLVEGWIWSWEDDCWRPFKEDVAEEDARPEQPAPVKRTRKELIRVADANVADVVLDRGMLVLQADVESVRLTLVGTDRIPILTVTLESQMKVDVAERVFAVALTPGVETFWQRL